MYSVPCARSHAPGVALGRRMLPCASGVFIHSCHDGVGHWSAPVLLLTADAQKVLQQQRWFMTPAAGSYKLP